MDKIILRFGAIIFSLTGAASVLLSAYARHGAIDDHGRELINIAANQQIIHSLLGLFFIISFDKFAKISLLGTILILIGTFCFFIPIVLLGFGVLSHTPSAPIGGFSFALSWIFAGFACYKFISKKVV